MLLFPCLVVNAHSSIFNRLLAVVHLVSSARRPWPPECFLSCHEEASASNSFLISLFWCLLWVHPCLLFPSNPGCCSDATFPCRIIQRFHSSSGSPMPASEAKPPYMELLQSHRYLPVTDGVMSWSVKMGTNRKKKEIRTRGDSWASVWYNFYTDIVSGKILLT